MSEEPRHGGSVVENREECRQPGFERLLGVVRRPSPIQATDGIAIATSCAWPGLPAT